MVWEASTVSLLLATRRGPGRGREEGGRGEDLVEEKYWSSTEVKLAQASLGSESVCKFHWETRFTGRVDPLQEVSQTLPPRGLPSQCVSISPTPPTPSHPSVPPTPIPAAVGSLFRTSSGSTQRSRKS